MLQNEKIILRPLNGNDSTELARLANNKKIWDNVRDFLPFPYTIDDGISFINMVKEERFYQLDYVRIHTGVFEYNIGSMKVLEKNGYKKDGVFEKAILKNGRIWNEHRYSKIK